MTVPCDKRMQHYFVSLLAIGTLAMCSACTSPEAQRVRGGGPGADTGNRDAVVELHGDVQPYYHTPCVEPLRQC